MKGRPHPEVFLPRLGDSPMLTPLLLTLTLAGPPADTAATAKKELPARKELFAGEDWYRNQEGKEQDFVGVLERADRGGRVGFGRFNPYRLKMEGDVREVYVGGKPEILTGYVGRKVKLT